MSHQPAIVVAAYSRPHALRGLLDSLLRAQYDNPEVRLILSLDYSGSDDVYNMANSFQWPFGEVEIIRHPQRLGLKRHILWCGALTHRHESIILLEDDLEVAPGFYRFAVDALEIYDEEPTIAGISLYSYRISESTFRPFTPEMHGQDTYLMQFPSSWGQAWTKGQWQGFEQWLEANPELLSSQLPPYIQKWGRQSWKKLFALYLLQTDKYFVYPRVSFTTNKGYPGAHFAMRLTLFEVPLYQGTSLQLPPIDVMEWYSIHFAEAGAIEIETEAIDVSEAEYNCRLNRGEAAPSIFEKWWFMLRYNIHNYWRAFWQSLP